MTQSDKTQVITDIAWKCRRKNNSMAVYQNTEIFLLETNYDKGHLKREVGRYKILLHN